MKKHMFKTILLSSAIVLSLLTVGCSGGGGDSSSSDTTTTSSAIAGAGGGASKGPFKQGSLVVAYKLVNGVRDVNVTTLTTDGRGHFDFGSTIPWTGPTEFVISGEYLNENTGTYMVLTPDKGLRAVTNMTAGSTEVVNINILTNIAAPAIKAALVANTSITQAKADAQADVAEMFNLDLASGAELSDLDLTEGGGDNAAANTQLLLISSALLSTDNPEQVMENLASGLEDGEADSTSLVALQEIQSNVANVDLQVVATAMEDADIGVTNAPNSNSALNGTLSFDHNISFVSQQDAFRNTVYTSNEATVVGMIGESGPISVTNGSYSIDGGAFVTTAGTVANGQKVRVRVTSSASYSTNVQAKLNIGGSNIVYNVTTKSDPFVADTTPNTFSFGFKGGQTTSNANVISDAVTITGINSPTDVTIDTGTFDVNGSDNYVASANITNGSTIRVKHTSSASAGTEVKSTLTIGGVSGTFSSFTVPEDKTPNVFTFVNVNDVNKTATPTVDSNTINIAGINTAAPVSVVGGEMNVAGAGFTSTATTINNGESLVLRAIPSDNFETTTTVTVTVGNVVSNFKVTTMSDPFVADTTPNAFSFSSKLNQVVSTPVDANITVSGINVPTPISILNGTYSVNGGAQDANVSNGDTVTVTQTTADTFDTQKLTTLTIGGVSATFKTKTKIEDKIPDTFSFDSNMSVTMDTLVTSNTITITGITAGTTLPISITNGEYEINGGGYTSVAGTVSLNDTLTIQQTSASTQGTSKVTSLTVGSTIRSFTTKTVVNAPNISGTPASAVAEDSEYTFIPTVESDSGEITTWSIINKPSWMEFNTFNGTLNGIPQNNDVGTITDINITAVNPQGSSSIIIASLEVTNTNDAPIANNIAVTTNEDTNAEINATAYVSDVDVGDSISSYSVTQPSHGSVVEANGILTYTPSLNYFGPDSFTYTVTDLNLSTATAVVDVNITSVNDAPIALNDTSTTPEDVPAVINVAVNDADVEGSSLNVTAVSTSANANATVSGTNVTYTPVANFFGTDTFTYTISDGNLESNATVTVTVTPVNDAATIGGATLGNVVEDGTQFISLHVTIDDVDTNESEVIAQTNAVKTYGTFDVNASGNWTYTLNNGASNVQALVADVNVTDSIVVTSKDGTDTETITVTITGTNDVATIGGNVTGGILEDVATTTGTITITDADTGESEAQAIVDANATYGKFNVQTGGAWTYTLTDSATIQALKLGQTLSDGIQVKSKDASATQDLNITITGVNDAPVAQTPQAYSIKKLSDLNITLSATDVDNDSVLTLTAASAASSTHTATVNIIDANGSITFNAPEAGAYTLSYTFKDEHNATASGTHNVTVTLSDAPVASNDARTIDEDVAINIDVVANDTDDNNATSGVAIEINPSHGVAVVEANSTITYTPTQNYFGSDTFKYRVIDEDGGFDVADVNITINAINDAPVASDDTNTTAEDTNVTISVLVNDSDVDGDDFNVTAVSQAANGSVTFTPTTVTYSPDLNYNGTDSFVYTVSDGNGGEDNATVSITVTPVNDAPVITISGDIVVVEDSNITVVDINITDVDATLDPSNVSMFSSDNSTAEVVDGNATTVSVMAKPNQNGAVTITLRAVDGNNTTEKTFMFTITAVNDAPVANPDTFSALFNSTNSVTWNILANDSDIDDTNLTISSCDSNSTQGAGVLFNSNEIYSYTIGDFIGTDTFNCTITDGSLETNSTVTVVVSGNHTPTTTSGGSITMTVGETITGMIIASGNDANETLTYTLDNDSSNLTNLAGSVLNADGTYGIHASAIGQGQIVVTITDDGTPPLSTTATFNINVIAVQTQVDPYEISDGGTITAAEFDAISNGLAIPADTKLYDVWGTDVDENNVTTLNSMYLEFLSSGEFIVSDDNATDYGHNGASVSYGLNGMVSVSEGSTTYDSNEKMVDAKLIATYSGSDIPSNVPALANFVMPEDAVAYKMAIKFINEKYDFYKEAEDWSLGSRDTYDNLASMINNDAHGIIDYNRNNNNRIIVFGNDQNYTAGTGDGTGSGTIVEVDMTDVYQNGGDPIVVNPNAGTWSVVSDTSVNGGNSDIVKVAITAPGYGDEDIILVEDSFDISGDGATNTVWKGDYQPAGTSGIEYRFNEAAMTVIQNAFDTPSNTTFAGSWYADDALGNRIHLVLSSDGHYFYTQDAIGQDADGDDGVAGGVEFGTLSVDNNGTSLHDANSTIQTTNDTAGTQDNGYMQDEVFTYNPSSDSLSNQSVSFTRNKNALSPELGAWIENQYYEDDNELKFLLMYENGTYLIAAIDFDYPRAAWNDNGDIYNMFERGTYTSNMDGTTFNFTVASKTADYNGNLFPPVGSGIVFDVTNYPTIHTSNNSIIFTRVSNTVTFIPTTVESNDSPVVGAWIVNPTSLGSQDEQVGNSVDENNRPFKILFVALDNGKYLALQNDSNDANEMDLSVYTNDDQDPYGIESGGYSVDTNSLFTALAANAFVKTNVTDGFRDNNVNGGDAQAVVTLVNDELWFGEGNTATDLKFDRIVTTNENGAWAEYDETDNITTILVFNNGKYVTTNMSDINQETGINMTEFGTYSAVADTVGLSVTMTTTTEDDHNGPFGPNDAAGGSPQSTLNVQFPDADTMELRDNSTDVTPFKTFKRIRPNGPATF